MYPCHLDGGDPHQQEVTQPMILPPPPILLVHLCPVTQRAPVVTEPASVPIQALQVMLKHSKKGVTGHALLTWVRVCVFLSAILQTARGFAGMKLPDPGRQLGMMREAWQLQNSRAETIAATLHTM